MSNIEKIEVCNGVSCCRGDIKGLLKELEENFPNAKVNKCSCLGKCLKGPNVLINESKIFHHCKSSNITTRIKEGEGEIYKRFKPEEIKDEFLGDV